MPGYLENLLKEANQSSKMDDRICGVIVDSPMAWMMEIPKKMGIKVAVFWCSTPGSLALGFKIPELLQSKFIDSDGTPLQNESIQLLPSLPAMDTTDLLWYFPSDPNSQKSMFHIIKDIMRHMQNANWVLCNWFQELNPAASNLSPNILSIGPLLANGQSAGSFCSEDSTCLSWLDKQPKSSVVYVAFGSTSRFSQQQLDELGLGLELMGRPFLWVAWSGLKDVSTPVYMNEYTERVAGRGKIVEWAPQEAVLAHPSTACFVTHCGWSSFMESLSMGVPLLCWPYFGDQLYTRTCVCEAWRVGMRLKADDGGVCMRLRTRWRRFCLMGL
ncbi:UNVERIFIED_CONTAM: Flavonol 3-O-glucosyltransferase F3GT2 [Sesamum latifolium]|uniref:Flavonol 3-O-glucosyltransferase F3GT2 n=1 Tax=Sesamum latifolium TaxID=2727402 RepID=A0AAW2UGD3_9LAMI